MSDAESVRPTKKQRELLEYIGSFIDEHGYSPSYREIMNGLQYNSVATVALHVGNLIKRGHLIKRTRSARSLELAQPLPTKDETLKRPEQWLLDQIELRFNATLPASTDELETLLKTLEILDLPAADVYRERLTGQAT